MHPRSFSAIALLITALSFSSQAVQAQDEYQPPTPQLERIARDSVIPPTFTLIGLSSSSNQQRSPFLLGDLGNISFEHGRNITVTVQLYSGSGCRGEPLSVGAGAYQEPRFAMRIPFTHGSNTYSVKTVVQNRESACSNAVTAKLDLAPSPPSVHHQNLLEIERSLSNDITTITYEQTIVGSSEPDTYIVLSDADCEKSAYTGFRFAKVEANGYFIAKNLIRNVSQTSNAGTTRGSVGAQMKFLWAERASVQYRNSVLKSECVMIEHP